MIYNNITELIGNTPLVRISNYSQKVGLKTPLLVKLECKNPAGSAKDRVAFRMIKDALESGNITKDSVIIEPTSGNTGVGLAAVAAVYGMKVILTMPDTMSAERRALLKAYGATLVLTDGKLGMTGAVDKANELLKKTPNSFIAGQFYNPSNPNAHFDTTGPEIWRDTDGKIDIFVAGAGTGGTVSGVGKYLKSKNNSIKIVAVEPKDSPLLSEGKSGPHKLQGIGANFVPDNLDRSVIDEIITVHHTDAYNCARNLASSEGILVGISSGAALYAGACLAKQYTDKCIVVLLPDTGERYLSTELWGEK